VNPIVTNDFNTEAFSYTVLQDPIVPIRAAKGIDVQNLEFSLSGTINFNTAFVARLDRSMSFNMLVNEA